jgi:hypothetical protein
VGVILVTNKACLSPPDSRELNMTDTRMWRTLTKTEHKMLCDFLKRFINISPDIDKNVGEADKRRIARVKKILNA